VQRRRQRQQRSWQRWRAAGAAPPPVPAKRPRRGARTRTHPCPQPAMANGRRWLHGGGSARPCSAAGPRRFRERPAASWRPCRRSRPVARGGVLRRPPRSTHPPGEPSLSLGKGFMGRIALRRRRRGQAAMRHASPTVPARPFRRPRWRPVRSPFVDGPGDRRTPGAAAWCSWIEPRPDGQSYRRHVAAAVDPPDQPGIGRILWQTGWPAALRRKTCEPAPPGCSFPRCSG
jgi:hypothetical protein